MILKFSKNIYPKECLLKAAYSFTDRYRILIDDDDQYYYIEIQDKNLKDLSYEEMNSVESDFVNESLMQAARFSIVNQTKELRELILARALSSTIVVNKEDVNSGEKEKRTEHSENILRNWFDDNR